MNQKKVERKIDVHQFKKSKKLLVFSVAVFAAFMLSTFKGYAVRPFITDDGVIARHRVLQWETWAYFNKQGGEQWNMFSFGVNKWLEVGFGGVWGYSLPKPNHTEFSFSTPLLETKYLLCGYEPHKRPGIAMAIGTALPAGKGEFIPDGYGAYTYLSLTHVFDNEEKFVIHGNIGINYLNANKKNQFISYGGIGTQIKLYKGLHFVGEVISGDPYTPKTGIGYQAGFRYFISDLCQIDAEIGQGLAGEEKIPFWIGCGFRIEIEKFVKKKK